jgi:hypothetical protein
MSMPVSAEYDATGTQTPINVDWMIAPSDIGIGIFVPSGTTVSMTVEGTYDDASNPNVTPDWFPITELGTVTDTKDALVPRPYQFVRANIDSISGGPIRMKVNQGLSIN